MMNMQKVGIAGAFEHVKDERIDKLSVEINRLRKDYNLEHIKVKFKFVKGAGRASFITNTITLPLWMLDYLEAFQYAYIVHELTHFIVGITELHNENFKRKESEILLREYGIRIDYKKAYLNCLRDFDGDILYAGRKK